MKYSQYFFISLSKFHPLNIEYLIKRGTGNKYECKSVNPDVRYPGGHKETNAMKIGNAQCQCNNQNPPVFQTLIVLR